LRQSGFWREQFKIKPLFCVHESNHTCR
jgi:hypothetical protein